MKAIGHQITEEMAAILDALKDAINQLLGFHDDTAHRLSTIRHMEGGSIIEEGTFDQLISNELGYFKKLWDSQVNGMVL